MKQRIQELEEELNRKLNDYGATYQVFENEMQGNKQIRGKHVVVTFPIKVKVDTSELVALFQEYYGDIRPTDKIKKSTNGVTGRKMKELVLNLED